MKTTIEGIVYEGTPEELRAYELLREGENVESEAKTAERAFVKETVELNGGNLKSKTQPISKRIRCTYSHNCEVSNQDSQHPLAKNMITIRKGDTFEYANGFYYNALVPTVWAISHENVLWDYMETIDSVGRSIKAVSDLIRNSDSLKEAHETLVPSMPSLTGWEVDSRMSALPIVIKCIETHWCHAMTLVESNAGWAWYTGNCHIAKWRVFSLSNEVYISKSIDGSMSILPKNVNWRYMTALVIDIHEATQLPTTGTSEWAQGQCGSGSCTCRA